MSQKSHNPHYETADLYKWAYIHPKTTGLCLPDLSCVCRGLTPRKMDRHTFLLSGFYVKVISSSLQFFLHS